MKQILYTKKQKYYHSEIKRKGSLKDFMYIAHCSFRLQVLKQVRCRQSYVLKNYGVLAWEHSSFSVVSNSLPIYQPLLGFHTGDYIAPWEPAYRRDVIVHTTQTSCAANVDKTLPSHRDCFSKHIVSITKPQQRLMCRQQIVYCGKQAMFSH